MKRKTYTREFKQEAVRLAEASERPIDELKRELNIHPNTLYKWRWAFLEDGADAFPAQGELKLADEGVRRLRRELARLKVVAPEVDTSRKVYNEARPENSSQNLILTAMPHA